MQLTYIAGADWQAFEERYPRAYQFLLGASLRGEEESLARELASGFCAAKRRAWIEERLADFRRCRGEEGAG